MGMFVFLVPKIPTFLASHKIGVVIGVTTLPPLINIPINPVFRELPLFITVNIRKFKTIIMITIIL